FYTTFPLLRPFFTLLRRPPSSPLFPYTTLFRSLLLQQLPQQVVLEQEPLVALAAAHPHPAHGEGEDMVLHPHFPVQVIVADAELPAAQVFGELKKPRGELVVRYVVDHAGPQAPSGEEGDGPLHVEAGEAALFHAVAGAHPQ